MTELLLEARCALPPPQTDEIFAGFQRAGFRLDPGTPAWARADDLIVVRATRYNAVFDRELAAAIESFRMVGESAEPRSDRPTAPLPAGRLEKLMLPLGAVRLPARTWIQVWDVAKMIGTGIELHVVDDEDASRQLDALAEALTDTDRSRITVKPRRGWQGYGLPGRL